MGSLHNRLAFRCLLIRGYFMTEKQKGTEQTKPPVPEPTTDMQFRDKVIRANTPVVVLVWAPHALQCDVMQREIEHIAPAYEGKVGFISINADKNPETFGRYNIRMVPTMLFFHDRRVVDRIVGLIPRIPLQSRIDHLLELSGSENSIDVTSNLSKWSSESYDTGRRAFLG